MWFSSCILSFLSLYLGFTEAPSQGFHSNKQKTRSGCQLCSPGRRLDVFSGILRIGLVYLKLRTWRHDVPGWNLKGPDSLQDLWDPTPGLTGQHSYQLPSGFISQNSLRFLSTSKFLFSNRCWDSWMSQKCVKTIRKVRSSHDKQIPIKSKFNS